MKKFPVPSARASVPLPSSAPLLFSALLLFWAFPALADEAPAPAVVLDSGATAWMLTSTALVLLMTVPGLAMFYAGMVRRKNILATMAQSFAVAALAAVLWAVLGYSLAFTGSNAWIGGFDRVLLSGLEKGTLALPNPVPESVFVMFQMTFAIITPALICGAFADRMKFSSLLVFTALWLICVYCPVAHWVWAADEKGAPVGFLAKLGVLDFAGGTVVHIDAGVAGLVACLVMGPRRGYKTDNMAPHDLGLAVVGASLLWVGWFGFNAGSAVAADGRAGMAMLATQLAAAAAALSWSGLEWLLRGKPSVLGLVSGAVAGLVAVTPASGFVDPKGALLIGFAAGAVCQWSAVSLKRRLGYDDSLDAFGVHGVGGILGALLTGVFAVEKIGGTAGLLEGNAGQVLAQLWGVLLTAGFAAAASWILLVAIDKTMGLRVSAEDEREGLDLTQHGESVH